MTVICPFFIFVTVKLILVEFCTQKLMGEFSVCSHLTLSKMFYLMMLLITEIVQQWCEIVQHWCEFVQQWCEIVQQW
jgi:hypothetical protein